MALQKTLANIFRSKKFYVVTLVLFILQGVYFAVAVNPSVQTTPGPTNYLNRTKSIVPDGGRHMAVIYYYANQPITDGPFVSHQTDVEVLMGDIERFPSYLYQYLLSFPARFGIAVGMSEMAIIIMVRLIGLVFGVLALFVFRRVVLAINAGPAIANLATLGMAFTGMFVYLSPTVNYDIPALFLWFSFMFCAVKLYQDRDPSKLYWMVVIGLIISITKYTYLPFAGLLGLVAIGFYVRKLGGWDKAWKHTKKHLIKWAISLKKWQVVGLAVLLLVSTGLFSERIIGNVIQYGVVSPGCTQVHSEEACMNWGVYRRNFERTRDVQAGTTWTEDYNFFDYTAMWLGRFYITNYYYMGDTWVKPVWKGLAVSGTAVLVLVAGAMAYLAYKRRTIFEGIDEWLLLGTIGVFVVVQYLFSAYIFIHYAGETFAHQGRYLLPIVGFVYVAFLLVVSRAYQAVPSKQKYYLLALLIAIGLIAFATNNSILNFIFSASTPEWYSDIVRF